MKIAATRWLCCEADHERLIKSPLVYRQPTEAVSYE
jgi:hypothetical protein